MRIAPQKGVLSFGAAREIRSGFAVARLGIASTEGSPACPSSVQPIDSGPRAQAVAAYCVEQSECFFRPPLRRGVGVEICVRFKVGVKVCEVFLLAASDVRAVRPSSVCLSNS